jgi:hypothetical protein
VAEHSHPEKPPLLRIQERERCAGLLAVSIPTKREASAGDHFFSFDLPPVLSIPFGTDRVSSMPFNASRSIIDAVKGWIELGNFVEAFQ